MVPPVEVAPRTLEKLDEIQGIQWIRMSVERMKKVLFHLLDLSGLDWLSEGNQAAAQALLAEYHDIFSLEPGEMGCMDLVKHEIRVVDNEPFKERFQRIPPLMVDEVHVHMEEMLEVGTIRPSQNPWCNAVVLVHRKDGGLSFCIDFHKAKCQNQERLLSTSLNTGSHRKPSWNSMFLLLGPKGRFWANCHG